MPASPTSSSNLISPSGNYGPVEGRTSAEVRAELGHDDEIFADGVHVLPQDADRAGGRRGEDLAAVRARADRFVRRVLPVLDDGGTVLAVAHGHLLRVLATAWLGVEPRFAAHLSLGCAASCVLGRAHGLPTIEAWNQVGG